MRVLQVIHQRKGKLRKHQRVWKYYLKPLLTRSVEALASLQWWISKFIRQRKRLSFVGSLSIIAVLLSISFLGHTRGTQVERSMAHSYSNCSGCVSYQVSANTDVQGREPFMPRHKVVPAKVHSTQRSPVSSTPTQSTPVTSAPTHSTPVSSTPTKSAPLPTQGSRNVFPYGSCTWWANQRYFQLHGIFVPWTTQSNAWQWTARAYQFGWHVSGSPVVGAIIDLQPGVQGASWAGHVAIVERVLSNGHVLASNMNWGAYPSQVTYVEFTPGQGVTFIYH